MRWCSPCSLYVFSWVLWVWAARLVPHSLKSSSHQQTGALFTHQSTFLLSCLCFPLVIHTNQTEVAQRRITVFLLTGRQHRIISQVTAVTLLRVLLHIPPLYRPVGTNFDPDQKYASGTHDSKTHWTLQPDLNFYAKRSWVLLGASLLLGV